MTTSKDERELAALVEAIREGLEANTEALNSVRRWKQRVARWAAAAVAVAVLACAGFGYALYQIHQSQLDACAIGNGFRAQQVRLWNHLVDISQPPPHETPAERQARKKLATQFLG